MEYRAVPEISRKEYEQMIQSDDSTTIADALLSISYWENDWKWAQNQLLAFSDHPSSHVRWTVAVGFGHIARFNGALDVKVVEPVLRKMTKTDPDHEFVRGPAEDSLEDIDIFIHRPKREGRPFEPAGRLK